MSEEQNYQQPYETSTLAIVSLVSGIVSWFLLPILGAIIAVITGHMAKREIRDSQGRLTGDGMATAGLVLGYLQLVLSVCGLCVAVIFILLGLSLSPILCLPFVNELGMWLSPLFGY
jgi:hypothetical protein